MHFLFINNILITVCLGVGLFRFILFGTVWAFWIRMSVSLPKIGKFLVIICFKRFSISFCYSNWESSTALSLSLLLLYSASSSLLLNPSNVFFFLIVILQLCDKEKCGPFLYFLFVEVLTVLIHCSPMFSDHLLWPLLWTSYQLNYLLFIKVFFSLRF